MNDNPNPRAYIGILCSHNFFYFALKSVYQNLEHVEFILDFTSRPVGFEYPEWYKERVRKFLTKTGVFWRDYERSPLKPAEFFGKYNTLVAPFYGGLLTQPCNKNKKKVRVFYGTAKYSWSFALWNAYFDLVLCPSDFYTEKMNRLYGPIAQTTGEPKLDALFDLLPDSFLLESGMTLDLTKPTLLYAPTWGALSSEEVMLPQLLQLLPEYNIIYKPHHMTLMSRRDAVIKLKRSTEIQVVTDNVSFMHLLKLDTVVLSDNSSAIFDAIQANRPLVLMDTLSELPENIHTETPFFTYRGGKFSGTPTTADSLEQVIKEEGKEIAPVVRTNRRSTWHDGSLKDTLLNAIKAAPSSIYANRQAQLKAEHLETPDGQAGKRVALAIQALIEREDQSPSEIQHYIDEFKSRVVDETKERALIENSSSDGSVGRIEQIKRLPYFEKMKAIYETFF